MQSRVRSKASLDKININRIGNNDIYTHILIDNKQTINVPSSCSGSVSSSFYTHIIIFGNFVSVISFLDLPGRLFQMIGLPSGEVFT